MEYILVGAGGFLGAASRFGIGRLISKNSKSSFPLGTFVVNVLGALLLGMVSSFDSGGNMYILAGDGFLGAFTTFSTFMYEGFNLFKNKETLNAFVYILLSLVLGISGYIIGTLLV